MWKIYKIIWDTYNMKNQKKKKIKQVLKLLRKKSPAVFKV